MRNDTPSWLIEAYKAWCKDHNAMLWTYTEKGFSYILYSGESYQISREEAGI